MSSLLPNAIPSTERATLLTTLWNSRTDVQGRERRDLHSMLEVLPLQGGDWRARGNGSRRSARYPPLPERQSLSVGVERVQCSRFKVWIHLPRHVYSSNGWTNRDHFNETSKSNHGGGVARQIAGMRTRFKGSVVPGGLYGEAIGSLLLVQGGLDAGIWRHG